MPQDWLGVEGVEPLGCLVNEKKREPINKGTESVTQWYACVILWWKIPLRKGHGKLQEKCSNVTNKFLLAN